jgi:transposase
MKENLTCDETSKRFGIGINSVVRWSKKLEPQRTRNKPATKINMEALKRDIESYPDAYQYERAQRLNVSTNCVHFALKRLHVTYKKSLCHPKASPEKRSTFCQRLQTYKEEGCSLVFLDESGFSHDMPRTHGYAPKGQRCYGKHDWGAKGRTNIIGALLAGVLLTISLFQTTINTEIFTAWIAHDLLPKLPPKSVIIMDNASFHKGSEMQKILAEAGHILFYLPPYSPDLNPIEKKWAQAKAVRRRVGGTIESLFQNHKI